MKDKISEDKIFEDYQDGLPEDFRLAEAKIRRKHVDLTGSMVQISMHIEYDLLKEIKQDADKKGIAYQALIKQILREHLKRSSLEQEANDTLSEG
jgi:predicted DNA binding CopG/RHH family protein